MTETPPVDRGQGDGAGQSGSRARERVTLPIFGLGCGGGGSTSIQRQLLRTPGVLWAYVNPATEMAHVEYHSGLITHDDVIGVVEELGYRCGQSAETAT